MCPPVAPPSDALAEPAFAIARRRPHLNVMALVLVLAVTAVAPGCGSRSGMPVVAPSSLPARPNATSSQGAAPPPSPPPAPRLLSPADLDALMAASWEAAHVDPAPGASDAEFLRRVTLDLAGRIPTADEVDTFLAAPDSTKRARLVDALLLSADHAAHWGALYLDLFVGRQFRKPGVVKQMAPGGYFVRAFQENRPYDRIARELLTFSGEILPEGAGLFLASHLKGGGPETAAAVTARLFLGVQIQCAQCHDHPTEPRYKQEDFFGLVAYFARTKDRQQRVGREQPEPEDRVGPPRMQEGNRPTNDGSAMNAYFLLDKPRGDAKFRKSGSDHETVVPPRFLGRTVPPLAGESLRGTLARSVIESDLFAKALVDRTWAQLFGSGIVEPWDDLGGENDPGHPALLKALAADFRASGFDVRHLLRLLTLSRAYALTSRLSPSRPGGTAVSADRPPTPPVFARAVVRRMTPEQIFRSLLVATGVGRMEGKGAEEMEKKIARLLRECLFVFGDEERAEIDTFNGNIPQALWLWNGDVVNDGARTRAGGTLARIMAATEDRAERLRRMFLATYSRPATATEQALLLPTLTGSKGQPRGGKRSYEDFFFALLASTEMLTIH